jgi:hypothetical protein
VANVLGTLETILAIAALVAVFWLARRLGRPEEDWLTGRLADTGWRVEYGGRLGWRVPLRLDWVDRMLQLLSIAQPLAVKDAHDFTAWFFEAIPYTHVLAVQHRWAAYPRIALRKRTSFWLSRPWRRSDPALSERCPELCRVYFVKAWGDKERAAAFLSGIETSVLGTKSVFAIEMRDRLFLVISTALGPNRNDMLDFAVQAAGILESAGVPDLFAGANWSTDPGAEPATAESAGESGAGFGQEAGAGIEVNGLPLPSRLVRLMGEDRWRHPGDEVLRRLIPFLTEPVDFLMTIEAMALESQGHVAGHPDSWSREGMKEMRGRHRNVPDLPWLDVDRCVFIAVNRVAGADVGIALDYRTSVEDPRVVASDWQDTEHFWRAVSPTFSEFVDALGL